MIRLIASLCFVCTLAFATTSQAETMDGPAVGSYIAVPGEVIIESERDVSSTGRSTNTEIDPPNNDGLNGDKPGKGKGDKNHNHSGKGKGKGQTSMLSVDMIQLAGHPCTAGDQRIICQ